MRLKTLGVLLAFAVVVGDPAFGKRPESPGHSASKNAASSNSASAPGQGERQTSRNYFNDDRKSRIRDYYTRATGSGKCPPGLAKKNNGCQPPGQARKWRSGDRLPHDVVYVDLPYALMEQLGRTPEGEKLIQVDSNLLLISVGTGLILEALDVQE